MQLEACAHPFFNELREPHARLPNGRPLPPLFNFKQEVCPLTLELNFDIYIIYCGKMECSEYFNYFPINIEKQIEVINFIVPFSCLKEFWCEVSTLVQFRVGTYFNDNYNGGMFTLFKYVCVILCDYIL